MNTYVTWGTEERQICDTLIYAHTHTHIHAHVARASVHAHINQYHFLEFFRTSVPRLPYPPDLFRINAGTGGGTNPGTPRYQRCYAVPLNWLYSIYDHPYPLNISFHVFENTGGLSRNSLLDFPNPLVNDLRIISLVHFSNRRVRSCPRNRYPKKLTECDAASTM